MFVFSHLGSVDIVHGPGPDDVGRKRQVPKVPVNDLGAVSISTIRHLHPIREFVEAIINGFTEPTEHFTRALSTTYSVIIKPP